MATKKKAGNGSGTSSGKAKRKAVKKAATKGTSLTTAASGGSTAVQAMSASMIRNRFEDLGAGVYDKCFIPAFEKLVSVERSMAKTMWHVGAYLIDAIYMCKNAGEKVVMATFAEGLNRNVDWLYKARSIARDYGESELDEMISRGVLASHLSVLSMVANKKDRHRYISMIAKGGFSAAKLLDVVRDDKARAEGNARPPKGSQVVSLLTTIDRRSDQLIEKLDSIWEGELERCMDNLKPTEQTLTVISGAIDALKSVSKSAKETAEKLIARHDAIIKKQQDSQPDKPKATRSAASNASRESTTTTTSAVAPPSFGGRR